VAQLFQNIASPLNDARFGDLVGYGLRFLSLTAVRPGEVNNAEWVEIDWDKARWIIPGEKMKMDKDQCRTAFAAGARHTQSRSPADRQSALYLLVHGRSTAL
jgi:integrase